MSCGRCRGEKRDINWLRQWGGRQMFDVEEFFSVNEIKSSRLGNRNHQVIQWLSCDYFQTGKDRIMAEKLSFSGLNLFSHTKWIILYFVVSFPEFRASLPKERFRCSKYEKHLKYYREFSFLEMKLQRNFWLNSICSYHSCKVKASSPKRPPPVKWDVDSTRKTI